MLNVRIGHDNHSYYVGFEPPLDAQQLAELPNPYPYGKLGALETAGWPGSAVVSGEKDSMTVLGIYKASLNLAPVVKIISGLDYRHMKYAERPPTEKESILKFIEGVLKTFDDSMLVDADLCRVDTTDGVISFISSEDEQ